MANFGFGLAADALSKGLANIPERTLETEKMIPEYQLKLLEKQKAQEALDEFRRNAGLRSLQSTAAIKKLGAEMPYYEDIAKATAAMKQVEPILKQLEAAKTIGETQKIGAETRGLGYKVDTSPQGDLTIAAIDPTSPDFGKVIARSSAEPTELDQTKINDYLSQMQMRKAQIEDLEAKRAQFGQLSYADAAKLAEARRWHDILGPILQARAEQMHAAKAGDVEKIKIAELARIRDDARQSVESIRTTEIGRGAWPGGNLAGQDELYTYMRLKQENKLIAQNNAAMRQLGLNQYVLPMHKIPYSQELEDALRNVESSSGFKLFSPSTWGPASKITKPIQPPPKIMLDPKQLDIAKRKFLQKYDIDPIVAAEEQGMNVEDFLSQRDILNDLFGSR